MAELRVTATRPTIVVQPDEFAGANEVPVSGQNLIDSQLAEVRVVNLKRAKVRFTLEASGSDNGSWNLELLIAMRGGQVHARALPGGKETTDFAVPLAALVSLLTHPGAGGSANLLHKPKAVREKPRPVLIPVAHHKGSVLFACESGPALLSIFHEIRDYAPVTLAW